ncbi:MULTISPECIES: glycosyltransferase family 9 protein [unclassified Nocardioides]|jgi:ADP-heptose:LPS heptosyltransferase|uniref:glycosyltransferase family 9 protein n=1 Tax=Nocardioides sp. URHA0032 TaxID=1380388 RepID=UPI00055A7AD9|nr:glycosyltransferase family 9 protein [Nocardioides sp. URHA0032]
MRTLAVRLDSLGDVLVTGPAIRALAARSTSLTLLCGPRGRAAAELLPGVDELHCWRSPWVDPEPGPVDPRDIGDLTAALAAERFDRAVVFTSFHQSPLPTALVCRMAGIPWVGAISEDYPGSLLDVRHRVDDDLPEPERALSLARACGATLPAGDDGRLALRPGAVPSTDLGEGYVVLHPGTSVPARAWVPAGFRRVAELLGRDGHRVVVTGSPDERDLTAYVTGRSEARDLGGRTDLAGLAGVLAGARAVVVGNTGPAHLAAAVGTPVVSLFAPTVPRVRWAPYGVPVVVLGDQDAPCRDTRATRCPVPGHPCLASVTPDDVVAAIATLSGPALRRLA